MHIYWIKTIFYTYIRTGLFWFGFDQVFPSQDVDRTRLRSPPGRERKVPDQYGSWRYLPDKEHRTIRQHAPAYALV